MLRYTRLQPVVYSYYFTKYVARQPTFIEDYHIITAFNFAQCNVGQVQDGSRVQFVGCFLIYRNFNSVMLIMPELDTPLDGAIKLPVHPYFVPAECDV
jgi:hypothetical protein